MAISRMQQPRQQYGLGSLVKKAVRGVKKIVKSPIGKAALIGGLGMIPFGGQSTWGRLAGMMSRGAGSGGIGKFLASGAAGGARLPSSIAARNPGFFSRMLGGAGKLLNPWSGGEFNPKHAFGLAAAGATALPFLMGGDDEEDVVEESWTQIPSSIADIRNQAIDYYRNPTASTLSFMPGKQFVQPNFYAADGGRAGLMNGGEPGQEQIEQMLMAEFVKYKNQGGTLTFEQFVQAIMQAQQEGQGMEQPQEVAMAADGGRIGYKWGGLGNLMSTIKTGVQRAGGKIKSLFDDADISIQIRDEDVMTDWGPQAQAVGQNVFVTVKSGKSKKVLDELIEQGYDISKGVDGDLNSYSINALDEGALDIIAQKLRLGGGDIKNFMKNYDDMYSSTDDQMIFEALKNRKADGGRIKAQEGGIMETEVAEEMIDMGGKEKDYRETGGFVDLGRKERADDVPARLSKNEFVFTADAVRNAGGGDIDKGSEVMQNLMDNLEAGGEISEESQGLEGAQAMYDQQQMLQSRMI